MKLIISLMLTALLATSSALAVDFNRALRYYEAKEFDQAREAFYQLAALGHNESRFYIGALYFRGDGVAQSQVDAYVWIALSTRPDNLQRVRMRDRLYSKLSDAEKAEAQGKLSQLNAVMGDQILAATLFPQFTEQSALVLTKQKPDVFSYPKRASRLGLEGSVDVVYDVATDGSTQHMRTLSASNDVFEEAALQVIKQRRFKRPSLAEQTLPVLGVEERLYFRLGKNFEEDYSPGSTLYRLLESAEHVADSGDAADILDYATLINRVPEARVSASRLAQLYFDAAQQGLATAQYQLARHLYYGWGVVVDTEKARHWFIRAAGLGYAPAQYFLAADSFDVKRMLLESVQAEHWLEQAQTQNYEPALLMQAERLATHIDASQRDGKAALALLKKIATNYPDQLTVNRIKASAMAAIGDFNGAQKLQRQLVNQAKKEGRSIKEEEKRLAFYQQQRLWLNTFTTTEASSLASTEDELPVEQVLHSSSQPAASASSPSQGHASSAAITNPAEEKELSHRDDVNTDEQTAKPIEQLVTTELESQSIVSSSSAVSHAAASEVSSLAEIESEAKESDSSPEAKEPPPAVDQNSSEGDALLINSSTEVIGNGQAQQP